MVKKLLFLITGSLMLLSLVSQSQPILSATGINPAIGDSYTPFTAAYVAPGGAGPTQTWDLSAMSGTSNGLFNAVAPSGTPSGASFTSANVAYYNATSGQAIYFNATDSTLEYYGKTKPDVMPYSNPEDYMHYPCYYTSSFNDTCQAQYISGPYTYYRKGTTIVTADGWGTLITPTATYTNVLRIHFQQVYRDSVYTGSVSITNCSNNEYRWYKEGKHYPLAIVYTLTSNPGGITTGGSYATDNIGIENIPALFSSSNLYPNPASDRVTIDFTLTENQKVNVRLFSAVGQSVKADQVADGCQGANTMLLDVTTLPKGIYYAQILLNGNVAANKRFVITN